LNLLISNQIRSHQTGKITVELVMSKERSEHDFGFSRTGTCGS